MKKVENGRRDNTFDVVIAGGLGHVGLPLGLVFADRGLKVCLYDKDTEKGRLVEKGVMPFIEYGGDAILKKVLKSSMLKVSNDAFSMAHARYIIVTIGTPIDEHLNPKIRAFLEFFSEAKRHISIDQTIIIRSTVYPQACAQISSILGPGKPWKIAYCPERIIQGYAVKELRELPQLVAGFTDEATAAATKLFSIISPKIIKVSVEEAELIKLFTNAWRYIQFAATNQFYMIAHSHGVDYDRVLRAMAEGYGRAGTIPGAGFAAGPCLLKDTMQLASFYGNNFQLGHAAMIVNEGLPGYIVENLCERHDLSKMTVGILGMAFKADIDDIRDALSYKLAKILRFHGAKVLCSDEYVKDRSFVSKARLIAASDIIIIGVPHAAYRGFAIPKRKEVIDLWGVVKKLKT